MDENPVPLIATQVLAEMRARRRPQRLQVLLEYVTGPRYEV
jgi:hypothetical protein